MPVVKEYECKAHGYFDGTEPHCPHGCPDAFVERVFLTPPTIGTASAKAADTMIRNLASDFGMTDVRNGKEGESVAQMTPASSMPQKPQWHSLGKNFDVRGMGLQSGNALADIKGGLSAPKPGVVLGRYDA